MNTEDFNNIVFENVSFAYSEGESIIRNLNMKLMRNKQYLVQGPSGSGKTTSMNLLLDYYEASSGNIKINDVKVKEIKNLNNLITVMRQDSTLFQDTLRNNITMYQNISDDKLISTLAQVGLAKYGNREKLDMLVDERGTNLSGGEKRRLTLARSLLRETPILILDEPMANLDEENAKAIESLILGITDRTVIIISHQFSKENITRLDEVIEFK